MKKIFNIILSTIIMFLSLSFVMMGGVVLWVVSAPRSLPVISEKIEEKLNSMGVAYKFSIRDTVLQWDGWDDNLNFYIKDLKIENTAVGADDNDSEFVKLPNIKIALDIPMLFLGNVVVNNAEFIDPVINYKLPIVNEILPPPPPQNKNYDKAITTYYAITLEFLKELDRFKDKLPLHKIQIKNGRAKIFNGSEQIEWAIPSADVGVEYVDDFLKFNSSFEVLDEVKSRRSFLKIKTEKSSQPNKFGLMTEITNIPSAYFSNLFPGFLWLEQLETNFSAKADIVLSNSGVIDSIDFKILSESGNDLALAAVGSIKIEPEFSGYKNVPYGIINIQTRDLDVAELGRYWPPNIAVDARNWVVNNIIYGKVTNLDTKIIISPNDYISRTIDKKSVNGSFKFSGLQVNYLEGTAPITNAEGEANFNTKSLIFDVKDASFGKSKVKGLVSIFDIDTEDPHMGVEVTTDGELADITHFLQMLQSGGTDESGKNNLLDISNLKGKATTSQSYKFPLLNDLSFKQIEFTGSAKLSEVELPDVIDSIKLSGGEFDLSVDNNGLRAEGSAYLNATLANIKWLEDFSDKKDFNTQYLVASYITAREFESMGGPKLRNVDGTMAAKLSVKQKDDLREVVAMIDLKDTKISVPSLGFTKKEGEAGELELLVEDATDKSYKIKSFKLTSKGLKAKGSAEIEKGTIAKSMINFTDFKIGKTDMKLRIINSGANDYVISVSGKIFDATHVLKNFSSGVEDKDPISIDVELLLENMILANNVVIKNVEGHVLCQKERCKSVGIHGMLSPKESVDITLKPDNKQLQFSILSDDGGRILKALNILNDVHGGRLATSALAPIDKPKEPYEGRLIMKDFKVKNAPILAKIVTLASFSGVVDLLNGDGISFEKMKGKYTFKDNVLKLREVKASGSSIAITIEGDVDFNSGNIKLQGNVVPATLLNSIIENIPLVGFAITGGGNESLIATRYTVTGNFSNPDVTVNPFSVLTPGFLRNIWGDVVDKDKDSEFLEGEDIDEDDSDEPAPIELKN